jgi:hypothetical protein
MRCVRPTRRELYEDEQPEWRAEELLSLDVDCSNTDCSSSIRYPRGGCSSLRPIAEATRVSGRLTAIQVFSSSDFVLEMTDSALTDRGI